MPFQASEILNPNRTMQRRLTEAEQTAQPSAPTMQGGPRFGKAFTPEEREKQMRARAEALRKRGY